MNKIDTILNKSWSSLIKRDGRSVGLVSVDLGPMPTEKYEGIWLARIKTPVNFRNKGYATKAMKTLIEACRAAKVDLYLMPGAYGENDGGLSQKQLINWYERLGFKEVNPETVPELYRLSYSGK